VDDVFKALASADRRHLLDALYQVNGQSLGELCHHLRMTRQAVTKHLRILEKASLIVILWRGREKLHYLNPAPLKQIAERWMNKHQQRIPTALRDLEEGLSRLEG
jgi:DNA-binding transcriptional ArsR family regulator